MFYGETRPFLHIILLIKIFLLQQIRFKGNIFRNKCCRCNEGQMHMFILQRVCHSVSVLFNFLFLCFIFCLFISLRKHAYSNILKILPTKNENFQIKNPDIYYTSAQNIDCGYSVEPPRRSKIDCGCSLEPLRRGGSNEYPQSMFWAEIRKNNAYPCKPQFYYIKVGFKGVKIV